MAVVLIMPKQGQSVESCIVTEIKKKKGDTVKKGDILFSYETDKASFEEESPVDGVILECFHEEGDEVPVLQPMMVIGKPGEDYSALLLEDVQSAKEEQFTKLVEEKVETAVFKLKKKNLFPCYLQKRKLLFLFLREQRNWLKKKRWMCRHFRVPAQKKG